MLRRRYRVFTSVRLVFFCWPLFAPLAFLPLRSCGLPSQTAGGTRTPAPLRISRAFVAEQGSWRDRIRDSRRRRTARHEWRLVCPSRDRKTSNLANHHNGLQETQYFDNTGTGDAFRQKSSAWRGPEEGSTIKSQFGQQRLQHHGRHSKRERTQGQDRCACQAQFQNTFMVS